MPRYLHLNKSIIARSIRPGPARASGAIRFNRFNHTIADSNDIVETPKRPTQSAFSRHLEEVKDHAHWVEKLATESEADIKADRGEIEAAVLDIKNRLEDVVTKLGGKKDEL